MANILWIISVILILLWVLGKFVVHIAVHLIDLALLLAVIIIIYNLAARRWKR